MKIKVREQEFEVKQTFRTYMLYEQITNKSFEPKTLSDIIIFLYAQVIATTKFSDFTYDEFMDWIDENPEVVTEFSEWLITVNNASEDTNSSNKKKGGKAVKK